MIELRNVTLGYEGIDPVENCNIKIPNSGVVAVLGASGVGKSTLLKGIAGLITPKQGEINKNEHKLSMVFQENRLLLTLNALENVMLVERDKHQTKKAYEMLKLVELNGNEEKLVSELSGGMQRRVSIARALMFGGNTLLLDEPFEGLDRDLRIRIAKRIREMYDLIIISSHDNDGELFLNNDEALFCIDIQKISNI
ncbi:MAG: ABC transporter ATP-binding protein [Clostridiales bacterium]|jgi:ABC-type nitrate/sulfonate/bicarbonate transport system ATPase subunit|nr:ABC transporter ATP-binding protein [Clostridiales bacterium]